MYNKGVKSWIVASLLVSFARADAPKIALPAQPSEATQGEDVAQATEPISTVVKDEKDKDWQEYTNRIVKAHVRVKSAWTVMEIKETKESGSVGFTLSRTPLVTFSITREPMDGSFEEYVSSPALTSIYPTGYKETRSVLAGRKATLIKGKAADGRFDESYFIADGRAFVQISFTAPLESWKEHQSTFAAIKQSLRWLP